jgi:hypothetical protein
MGEKPEGAHMRMPLSKPAHRAARYAEEYKKEVLELWRSWPQRGQGCCRARYSSAVPLSLERHERRLGATGSGKIFPDDSLQGCHPAWKLACILLDFLRLTWGHLHALNETSLATQI